MVIPIFLTTTKTKIVVVMAFDNKQPVELSVYILITREWQNICPYIDISLAMVWEQYFSQESAEYMSIPRRLIYNLRWLIRVQQCRLYKTMKLIFPDLCSHYDCRYTVSDKVGFRISIKSLCRNFHFKHPPHLDFRVDGER